MNKNPIFIHSLFRAGSTYLFNVFRRSDAGFWCYQEPMHELAFFSKDNPDELLVDHGKEKQALLRHPSTSINYFQELYDTWSSWKDVIKEEAIYDDYFEHDPSGQMGLPYWLTLINAAKGRPVFQECRTSGRIGAIKESLAGYHIYLWRNPWDQWWSYKVASYFDVATQLIVHSKNAPISVQRLCKELSLPKYEVASLEEAISTYSGEPLSSEQSYLLFYILWCLALRAGLQEADMLINLDRLSSSEKYREKILGTLKRDADITGIDFSDCNAPQALYDQRDAEFFCQLEDRVYRLLLQDEWQQQEIDTIKKLRKEYQPNIHQQKSSSVIASITEQSSRARELARHYETELAWRARVFEEELKQADIAKHHAELMTQINLKNYDPEIRDLLVRVAAAERTKVVTESELEKTEKELYTVHQANHHHWNQLQQRKAQVTALESELEKTKAEFHNAHQANHYHWTLLQQRDSQLNALLNSYSWRITAPLRFLRNLIVWLLLLPFRMAKAIALPFAIATMKFVLKRPQMCERWANRLRKYPRLFANIRQFALHRGLIDEQPKSAARMAQEASQNSTNRNNCR